MKSIEPITIKEAAELLGISGSRVYQMIENGKLHPIKGPGVGIQLDKDEVNSLLGPGGKAKRKFSLIQVDGFSISSVSVTDDPKMLSKTKLILQALLEYHALALERDLRRLAMVDQKVKDAMSLEYFACTFD